MKTFIYDLLSNSESVSHKRTVSMISVLCLILILVCDLCGIKVTEYLTFVFLGMTGYNSSLSVIEKLFNKNKQVEIPAK